LPLPRCGSFWRPNDCKETFPVSTSQQPPAGTPGWGEPRAPVGHPALQQTAAAHLRPGETLIAAFAPNLDPLLPLYYDREIGKHEIALAPVRAIVNGLRGLWRGIWTYFLPRWVVTLFIPNLRYRRPYGLRLERRAYRAIRRRFHGGSWSGGKESMAGQLWKAVRTTPGEKFRADHDYFTLVLTDQRMLILSRHWGFERHQNYQATVMLEYPQGTYALRRDTPKSYTTFRHDLTFNDGSWIALWLETKDDMTLIAGALG
jgi:hypothetical protein